MIQAKLFGPSIACARPAKTVVRARQRKKNLWWRAWHRGNSRAKRIFTRFARKREALSQLRSCAKLRRELVYIVFEFDSIYPHSSFNSFSGFFLYLSSFSLLFWGFFIFVLHVAALYCLNYAHAVNGLLGYGHLRVISQLRDPFFLTHMYNSVRTGRRDARTVRPSTGLVVPNKHLPFMLPIDNPRIFLDLGQKSDSL